MSKVKVTYFDVRAIAEPIRMILHYMDKDFDDVRVKYEDWLKMKPSVPFGKLPTVEIDGKLTHQSVAICRYFAKEAGLAGKNNWEDLQIDIVVDTFQDFRKEVSLFHHEPDPDVKEKKLKELLDTKVPYYFERFDKIVKENNGYLANGKLSWADFYLGGFSDSLIALLKKDVFENYPNLQAWRKMFMEIPKVKEWVAKRPVTHI